MDNVKAQLALECVRIALRSRVLPKKDETASEFAHRLNDIGSGILSEMLMEEADDGDDGAPASAVYSEGDDVSQEYEPEETMTDDVQVQTVELQDGTKDTFDPAAPSVATTKKLWDEWSAKSESVESCPRCLKCCEDANVEEVFGFRNMRVQTSAGEVKVRVRQSWCRACRLEALKEKRATGFPDADGLFGQKNEAQAALLSKVIAVLMQERANLRGRPWPKTVFTWTLNSKKSD